MSEQKVNKSTEQSEEVSVSVHMKTRYMYSFLFQHLHRSFRGIFGVCISLAALVAFAMSFGEDTDMTRRVVLLIIGLLFTVVNPILLLFKAYKQVKLSPVFKHPLEYTFSDAGRKVAQGDEEQFVSWDQVLEVRKTPSILIVYTSKGSGSILAYKELGEKRRKIEEIIARNKKKEG